MSFDLFVQCHRDGGVDAFPRQWARDAFGSFLDEAEQDFWRVRYGATDWCEVYVHPHGGPVSMMEGFMVSGPCGDGRFWDALASLLRYGNLVLFFPGCRAPMIGQTSVKEHLPPEMIDSLGEPIIVTSGREILDEIHAA